MSVRSRRPSSFASMFGIKVDDRTEAQRAADVDRLASLYEQRLGFWNQQPLEGDDLKEVAWLQCYGRGDNDTLEADIVHNATL